MRFDHFVLQQPKELIRVISKEGLKKIHERILDGLPVDIPFPEQGIQQYVTIIHVVSLMCVCVLTRNTTGFIATEFYR